MKLISTKNVLICLCSMLLSTASASEIEKHTLEARALVKTFGSDLKKVLTTSIKSGGPLNAIQQCNIEAEPIAKKNAELSGWSIARTSLKVRNENNKADTWEFSTLSQFEKRKAAGEPLHNMEYAEIVKDGEKTVFRYMKPIPTVGVCTACHGVNLSGNITEKVQSLYPNDQATGFSLGDIRGAFSFKKIL